MFKFLQSPHLAISYCATSVSEVKASSSVWLLDRVYKRNWFSRASLKVALWGTRQQSAPTSKAAFVWPLGTERAVLSSASRPPESPWEAGECFYSWFTGKKQAKRSEETHAKLGRTAGGVRIKNARSPASIVQALPTKPAISS